MTNITTAAAIIIRLSLEMMNDDANQMLELSDLTRRTWAVNGSPRIRRLAVQGVGGLRSTTRGTRVNTQYEDCN